MNKDAQGRRKVERFESNWKCGLSLSRTGVTFTAVSGRAVPPVQLVEGVNLSSAVLQLRADVETLAGGNWLQVSPLAEALPGFSRRALELSADPGALAPGVYYALVRVAATTPTFGAQAAGSPQTVTVVFEVVAPGVNPGPVVQPGGLLFVADGSGGVGPQQVQITNLTANPITVLASVANPEDADVFEVSAAQVNIPGSQSVPLALGAASAGQAPGIHRGSLDLMFDNGSPDVAVGLVLIVAPDGTGVSLQPGVSKGACIPSELAAGFTTLGGGASVPAGWPVSIDAAVFTDCGRPVDQGAVVVDFDGVASPSLALAAVGNGTWSGTWNAPGTTETIAASLTVTASSNDGLSGTFRQDLSLEPNADAAPRVFPGGVAHSATFSRDPLAPGTIVTLFGENLSTEPVTGFGQLAPDLPLPEQLAGTQALLGGFAIPLLFSREDQVNGILPFALADRVNESLPLVVRRGSSLSFPEPVLLVGARPGGYTQNTSGAGAGSILDLGFQLVTAENPVKAGDIVQIFCTGLGEVTPAVESGVAAPANPLSVTTQQITVTIGGQNATVLFSGLAPGFAGLYQLNVTIPDGLPPGDAEIVISVGDQPSPPVSVSIGQP